MKNFKIAATILAFFLIDSFANSQVNTEKLRKIDFTGFDASLQANVGIDKGNSDYLTLKTVARVDYSGESFKALLVGNGEYKEGNKEVISDKGFAHLRGIVPLTQTIMAEAFVQKEYNEFIKLTDRNIAGAGLRIAALDDRDEADSPARVFLFFGAGAMFEHEQFELDDGNLIVTRLVRSTNYMTFNWLISETTYLKTVTYYQFDVAKAKDLRVLHESTLAFEILENLYFNVQFDYRYDSEPVSGVKKYDLEISNGITVNF